MPSTTTRTRPPTAFASLDHPRAWPATRARPRPERLERELDVLPGVGVTLKRKLAKLGLVTVRDLLEHRPRRYESAADVLSIAELRDEREVVIAGEVRGVTKRPLRGRRTLVTARIEDGELDVSLGAAEDADLNVEIDMDTFFALASGQLALREAVKSGRAQVTGDAAARDRCFRVLSLAPRVNAAA